MAWAKVDDKLFSHSKWIQTPKGGKALWVSALSWCAGQETDGVVPKHVLPILGGTTKDANDLVRAGLWELQDGGYVFHDWVEYQPDAASQAAKRRAESDGGKRGMHTRWHTNRGLFVPDCQWCEEGGRPDAGGSPDRAPDNPPYEDPYSPLNTPYPARTRTHNYSPTTETGTPRNARERNEPEPPPEPEFGNVNAVLQAAGLTQAEIQPFKVALKVGRARSTTAVINALHRDGKLARRIAEFREERDVEQAARQAKPSTTSDRVQGHADLVRKFAEAEGGGQLVQFPQLTEGA